MNGFIFYSGNFEKLSSLHKFYNFRYKEESLCRITIGNSGYFVAWGSNLGDIHYSRNGDKSFLILSGYISAAKYTQGFQSQQDASDLLLEVLDKNHSIESCSKIADQIHGSFSILYLNSEEEKVYCITDRIASRPIWFKKEPYCWIISSNANSITFASDKLEYDLGALGSFLLYGGPVEPNKSVYRGIKAIEQGVVLVLESDGNSRRHQWYRYRHNPDKNISLNEWSEIAAARLREVATRILNKSDRPLIFLSGGIDSRLTTSALRAVGGEPILATLGDSENLEIRVAKSVAAVFKCQHEIILRDPHWYLRSLKSNVLESGGGFLWTHGHYSNAYRELQIKFGVDSAMLGDFCEAFSRLLINVDKKRKEVWTPIQFQKEFDTLLVPAYRPAHRKLTLNLINPKVRCEMEQMLQQDIINRYMRVMEVSDDPSIVGDHFFRWESAATIATFFMFLDVRSVGAERSLMFDKDIHRLLEILPSSIRHKANLGARIISKLWPPAAKVVSSNTLLPLSLHSKLHTIAIHMRPVCGRMRRLLFDNSYKTTGSFPLRSLLYSKDSKWHELFSKIISNDSLFDENIFDFKAIQDCWASFCRGELTLASDIEKLIQIGLISLYKDEH